MFIVGRTFKLTVPHYMQRHCTRGAQRKCNVAFCARIYGITHVDNMFSPRDNTILIYAL